MAATFPRVQWTDARWNVAVFSAIFVFILCIWSDVEDMFNYSYVVLMCIIKQINVQSEDKEVLVI